MKFKTGSVLLFHDFGNISFLTVGGMYGSPESRKIDHCHKISPVSTGINQKAAVIAAFGHFLVKIIEFLFTYFTINQKIIIEYRVLLL